MYPDGIPPATTVARKIQDRGLRMKAVYGNQYTPNAKPSTQNVDILLQGNVSIQPVGNRYKLTAPINHNSGEDIVGQSEPVFMAIYKGDRSNYGIKGARLVISAKGGRSIKQYV